MENAPIPLEGQFPLALRFWPSSPSMTMQPMNSCETYGTIEIGQGTFGWKNARGKKGFKRIAWSKLADILDDI